MAPEIQLVAFAGGVGGNLTARWLTKLWIERNPRPIKTWKEAGT